MIHKRQQQNMGEENGQHGLLQILIFLKDHMFLKDYQD